LPLSETFNSKPTLERRHRREAELERRLATLDRDRAQAMPWHKFKAELLRHSR
jgi:type II secretory pathway component PulJ